MFVALRDLRFAKGRFALMLTVIVLVAFLVGFLATLTGGLARASTSAITELPADRLAFSTPDGAAPDFTTSSVTAAQVDAWREVPGVTHAEPLGVVTTRATADGTTASVTAIGVAPGSGVLPDGTGPAHAGDVVLSEGARTALGGADGVAIGGERFTVAGVAESDASFAHTPVVWLGLRDWQAVGSPGGEPGATVVALGGSGIASDAVAGMSAVDLDDARSAIGSFTSENGSLLTITGFLIAISALVISAFFSVWTVNRTGDLAVLKALGASSGYLLRDALGQAALVLAAGVALGTALAWLTALALNGTLPVLVDAGTLARPAVLLVIAGLLGAGAAIGRITRIDPHDALAAR